jgi:hypothetical protein
VDAEGVLVRVLPKLGVVLNVGDTVIVADTVLVRVLEKVGVALIVSVGEGVMEGVGDGDDAISISHMYRRLPLTGTSLSRFENC